MGFFDFLKKENRDAIKQEQREIEDGALCYVVTQKVQELIAKGESFKKLGRETESKQCFDEALRVARRGLDKYPDSFALNRLLCWIYQTQCDYENAGKGLALLIAKFSSDPKVDLTEPYTRLGVIKWYGFKNIPAALGYLNLALKSATNETDADVASEPHVFLAQIYYEIKDLQRARDHALKRLQVVKECPMALMVYEQVKNAVQQLEQDQGAKLKWHIVAEFIKPPVVLQGRNKCINITSREHYTKIIGLLIGAKDAGWRGGDSFFVISKGEGLIRRFETGMAINSQDARELAEKIKYGLGGWQEDTQVTDFVTLCEDGGFRVQA